MIIENFNGEYDQVLIYDKQNLGGGRSKRTIMGKHIGIFADIGGGKTTAEMDLLEELYDHKHTIIPWTDEKDDVEMGFVMFEPEEEYHLNKLKAEGRKPIRIPAKLYHPFTFNIPKGQLPRIDFFTISIKSLLRALLSVLTETMHTSEAVNLCLRAIRELRKDEGIYTFMQKVDGYIKDHEKKYRGRKIDSHEDTFLTSGKMAGTKKELAQVISMFEPYVETPIFMPDNFPLNLDFGKIVNDQEHYHIFLYKWLPDEKQKYVSKIAVFEELYEFLGNKDKVKYRVALGSDEISAVFPDKPSGYVKVAAGLLRQRFKTIRTRGKGVITASCGQVFYDVEQGIQNLLKYKYFGRLSAGDIERLAKIYKCVNNNKEMLAKMPLGQFISPSMPSSEPHTTLMPQHMLPEEGANFFQLYRKYYGQYMDTADKQKKLVKDALESEWSRIKAQKDEEIRRQKEAIKREEEQKRKRQEEKEKEERRKPEGPVNKVSPEVETLIIEAKKKNPRISIRQLARDFKVSHPTVSRILKENKEAPEKKEGPAQEPEEQVQQAGPESPETDAPLRSDMDG